MKKILPFLILAFVTNASLFSQLVNCNPDPNGPIWVAGDVLDYTPQEQVIIDNMNTMEQNSTANLSLYPVVTNNDKSYFPTIMNQGDIGLCSQASAVCYLLTYELNYFRETTATQATKYHPSFIYNFLNNGENEGSSLIYTFEALKEVGGISFQSYLLEASNIHPNTQMNLDITEWISGYDNYEEAMSNKVTSVEKIDLTSNDVTILKHWLLNHNDDNQIEGGLCSVIFEHMDGVHYSTGNGSYINTIYIDLLSDSTNDADAHAMTIVGYDDNYEYGSGQTGALRLANSWGSIFGGSGDVGYCYLPYSYINMSYLLRRDNNNKIWAFAINVNPNYNADFILRQSIDCSDRSRIGPYVGENEIIGINIPNEEYRFDTYFDRAGDFNMLGANSTDELEFSLDYSYFLNIEGNEIDHNDISTYYFGIWHRFFNNPIYGTLNNLELIDNRCNNPITIANDSYNFPEPFNYTTTPQINKCWFNIDYIKLKEIYDNNQVNMIENQTYCHCQSNIKSGTTLEFANNSDIWFFDGIIEIEPGGILDLKTCNIRLKQGINKIIVRGDLIFTGNPTFISEGGSLEIEYHNEAFPPIDYEIINGNFYFTEVNRLNISGESQSLTIKQSRFNHLFIDYFGDLTIQNINEFSDDIIIDFSGGNLLIKGNQILNNTFISASFPETTQNSVTIEDNTFKNLAFTGNKSVISIDDYSIFSVENNEIELKYCNGIELYHAGNNIGANKYVSFNEIYSTNAGNECRAIDIFFRRADILNNYIHHNEYGVVAFGSSETMIIGNKDANNVFETQQFIDNTIHCYFSYTSYPEDIRYNYFEHHESIEDPYVKLVYFDLIEPEEPPIGDGSVIYNIECNAWYSTFNPEEDLIPSGSYDYDPSWNIGQYCVKDGGEAGELYDEAKEFIDSSYYSQADSNFKEIISDFPEDPHAIQSLRELYNIEESNGNDYDSLRLYYKTVITANQDSLLCRSADWMSMHCLIMMDSSQKAIDWLDSTINIPQNTVDSIFAIINLGYIYTHFPDTTLKSALYTTHNEHIPRSYSDYKIRREELFQTLLKTSSNENESEDLTIEKNATIVQIVPNPTQDAFNAKLEIVREGYLKIEVYSALGAKINEINFGNVQKGIIERNISLIDQPQGMYYVVVKHNNAVQETEKVIKM